MTAFSFQEVPRSVLVAGLVALAAVALALSAHVVRRRSSSPASRKVTGSRIALSIGDNFAPSDRFTGFVHEESGASIALMDLPATAYAQLRQRGKASETFAAQGVSSVTEQPLPGRQGDYLYLRGEQKTALVEYAKYILVFFQKGRTGMITANIPVAALKAGIITRSEVEAVLRSAVIEADLQAASAAFRLGYLGPFEEDAALLGTTKGYKLKGNQSNGRDLAAIFFIAPSPTQARIPNLSLFAERSFDGIDQVHDKSVDVIRAITVGGLNAVEVHGQGRDTKGNAGALVYQTVVEAPHGGYFRLVGLAPPGLREQLLPEFERMTLSFTPSS